MTAVHSLANWIGQDGFRALASLGFWATVVLSLAWLMAVGLRRSSAAVRYCLWQLALASLLVLPLLYALVPGVPLGLWVLPPTGSVGETEPEVVAGATIESTGSPTRPLATRTAPEEILSEETVEMEGVPTSAETPRGGRPGAAASTAVRTLGHAAWPLGVTVVWAIGVLIHFMFLTSSVIRARRLVRGATPFEAARFGELLNQLASRFSVKGAVLLLKSPQILAPVAVGVRRSRILLPAESVNWSTARIRIVLSHEMAHIERQDVFWQLVARTGAALYWFHPLVWLAVGQMKSERERACDDRVLLDGVNSVDYASALVEVAAALGGRRVSLLGGITMAARRPLEPRLRRILDDSQRRGRASHAVWRRLLLGATCFVLALISLRPFTPIRAATDRAVGTPEPKVEKEAAESEENTAPAAEAADTENYTFPISVSGRATDVDGNPISGAEIYISSHCVEWKRLGETKTDNLGRYSFSDVPLPIFRAETKYRPETSAARDNGSFIVFGRASGYGFSWRPDKWFYPKPNPGHRYVVRPTDDMPTRYEKDDKIELNLRFSSGATVRGTVLDEKANPIADTELWIWLCERIPVGGYGPKTANSSRRPFNTIDMNGFHLLDTEVPPEMWFRRTDADGAFTFTDLPAGCRFRIRVRPPGFPSRMVWVATRGGLPKEHDGLRLHDGSEELKIVFGSPREISIQVLYGDTGKPAPKVWVEAFNNEGSSYKTTDPEGRVSLGIPRGEYELKVLPAHGTPYLETETTFRVEAAAEAPEIVARLRPAAEVEIQVVDEKTGQGIGNVDLWREAGRGYREWHYTTSWEVATRTVHRDRHRTDRAGVIRALFEPGKHRIGVAKESYPKGYRPVEPDGRELDCQAGKRLKVVFFLRRASEG